MDLGPDVVVFDQGPWTRFGGFGLGQTMDQIWWVWTRNAPVIRFGSVGSGTDLVAAGHQIDLVPDLVVLERVWTCAQILWSIDQGQTVDQ